jgi:hypothetical protein
MSRMKTATETGLLICERISKESLAFIEEWDPDLHYEIMQERKKRNRSSRRRKKK